jgi:FKBP-type peptidyl-prolyl cis-trans isomerase
MKKLSIFLIAIGLSFACSTDNTIDNTISAEEQLAIDIALIDNWLADTTIADIIEHPTGIRYTINEVGTGTTTPRLSDVVEANYEGRYLETGGVFDRGIGSAFILSQTIWGWQIMVPEMKEGGKITIYLPSLYAYGSRGNSSIPPNALLVFDIELIQVR